MIRELAMEEAAMVAGGTWSGQFNDCMAANWWADTSKGAVGGAIAGAFLGPGVAVGAVVGAMAGSTSSFGYCAVKAL